MSELLYKPNTIQIEFAEGCNRHCEFCGTAGMDIKQISFMSWDILKRVVSEIKRLGWNSCILIACHGEPTLHPKHLDYIRYIRQELPKQRIAVMSNGYSVLKDIEAVQALLDAGVTSLNFDEYADNPLTDVLVPYLQEHGIDYEVDGKANLMGTKQKVFINLPIEVFNKSITRKLTNHCGAGMPPLEKPMETRCPRVFREILVRWDGNVAICCNDFRGEYPIANVQDMPLDELWMHPRWEAARRILYAGDRDFNPCDKCNATPIRPGLLPDYKGEHEMPEPTEEDYALVDQPMEPYSAIRKRPWEE